MKRITIVGDGCAVDLRTKFHLGKLLASPKRALSTDTDGMRPATYLDDMSSIAACVGVPQTIGALTGGVLYLDAGWQQIVNELRCVAVHAGVTIETDAKIDSMSDIADAAPTVPTSYLGRHCRRDGTACPRRGGTRRRRGTPPCGPAPDRRTRSCSALHNQSGRTNWANNDGRRWCCQRTNWFAVQDRRSYRHRDELRDQPGIKGERNLRSAQSRQAAPSESSMMQDLRCDCISDP